MGWFSEKFGRSNPSEQKTEPVFEEVDFEEPTVEEQPVEVPPEPKKVESVQEPHPDESQRIAKPEDAYAEAHYVNAKYGNHFQTRGETVRVAELVGDKDLVDEQRKFQDIEMKAINEHEIPGLNSILIEAAKKNIGLNPYFRGGGNQDSDVEYLHQYLKRSEDVKLTDFDPNSRGNLDYQKLEYLAGKLGTEFQDLIEKKVSGTINVYPVAKLAETNSEITFLTNGTGIEMDFHPRVFKMNKANMTDKEYRLEKREHNSIFPNVEQAEQSATT
jgi:hypothetical protein